MWRLSNIALRFYITHISAAWFNLPKITESQEENICSIKKKIIRVKVIFFVSFLYCVLESMSRAGSKEISRYQTLIEL